MPWGFVAAGVGAIAGAAIQGSAAQSAAQTQANAANQASQTQLKMFDTTQANLAPYMRSGVNALGSLNAQLPSLMTPFSATQYQQSPGYAWQMGQGVQAVQNSAAAAGGIKSGNTLQALTNFGQGLANSDYQQAYQNYMQQQQQSFNMLNTLAAGGQNAAAGLGGISTQVGGQIGSNLIGAGNALAAGQVGSANAIGGGINSLAQVAALYGNGASSGGGNPYNLGGSTPVASPGGQLQYDQWGNIIGGGPG